MKVAGLPEEIPRSWSFETLGDLFFHAGCAVSHVYIQMCADGVTCNGAAFVLFSDEASVSTAQWFPGSIFTKHDNNALTVSVVDNCVIVCEDLMAQIVSQLESMLASCSPWSRSSVVKIKDLVLHATTTAAFHPLLELLESIQLCGSRVTKQKVDSWISSWTSMCEACRMELPNSKVQKLSYEAVRQLQQQRGMQKSESGVDGVVVLETPLAKSAEESSASVVPCWESLGDNAALDEEATAATSAEALKTSQTALAKSTDAKSTEHLAGTLQMSSHDTMHDSWEDLHEQELVRPAGLEQSMSAKTTESRSAQTDSRAAQLTKGNVATEIKPNPKTCVAKQRLVTPQTHAHVSKPESSADGGEAILGEFVGRVENWRGSFGLVVCCGRERNRLHELASSFGWEFDDLAIFVHKTVWDTSVKRLLPNDKVKVKVSVPTSSSSPRLKAISLVKVTNHE